MILSALLAMSLGLQTQSKFSITEIPLPASQRVYVTDVNDSGQICGILDNDSKMSAVFRAGIKGAPEVLGPVDGGMITAEHVIASDGTVTFLRRDGKGSRIWRWHSNGKLSNELLSKEYELWSPDRGGECLLSAYKDNLSRPERQHLLRRHGKSILLQAPEGTHIWDAVLPKSGYPAATVVDKTGSYVMVWDRKGSPTLIPTPNAVASVIDGNEAGEFVGKFGRNGNRGPMPFLLKDKQLRPLDLPSGTTTDFALALDINNKGQILCAADLKNGLKRYWITDGTGAIVPLDIDLLMKPDWTVSRMNDKGQVVFYSNAGASPRAVLVSISKS